MKKNFLLVAAIASVLGFASCNGDEIARLQNSVDSLKNENDMLAKQNDEEMQTITEVMDNFSVIREQQLGLSQEAESSEGVTEDKKQKIQDNFKLIQDKFQANAAKLDSLESALASNKKKYAALAGTISSLKKQLTASKAEIANLQKQLEDKNIEIQQLQESHNAQVAQMTAAKATADSINAATIKAQDIAAHTVYYVIDTKSNLKAKGIKGSAGQLKKGDIKESMCKKVDYREFEGNNGINFKKEPVLYSYHTPGTYSIKKNADKTYTFTITNPDKFWNTKTMVLVGERK